MWFHLHDIWETTTLQGQHTVQWLTGSRHEMRALTEKEHEVMCLKLDCGDDFTTVYIGQNSLNDKVYEKDDLFGMYTLC